MVYLEVTLERSGGGVGMGGREGKAALQDGLSHAGALANSSKLSPKRQRTWSICLPSSAPRLLRTTSEDIKSLVLLVCPTCEPSIVQ